MANMLPQEDKNEPSRFLGDGVSFKAKLIGILEVSEARGDRMCQEALADLKMAIRAAGEHKQRIVINIAIDGLRLRDEKTGDSLYHHPVHKISFIAQDMSDSRAFGYIFGSPDTGHRFFGIKTDKAASQVVIAMRDLFQVVFELKKKEIELAKQHIEQKSRFGSTTSTSIFAETSLSNPKSYQNGETHSSSKFTSTETASKSQNTTTETAHGGNSEAIADLVDLELELNSIQQGIHQMERITPSDPFGPNKDDPFNNDPFGDSFINYPQKPFLPPPPPSGRERQNRIPSDTSSGLFSPKTPKTGDSTQTNEANLFKVSQDDSASCDWFSPMGSGSLFDDQPITQEDTATTTTTTKATESSTSPQQNQTNTGVLTQSQIDVFTELDPLGTGRSKPYIDKKLFFQELKNPPKKVLKDLVSTQPQDSTLFPATFDNIINPNSSSQSSNQNLFSSDPFAESDPFDKTDPFSENDFTKTCDPFDTDFIEDFKVFNKHEQSVTTKTGIDHDSLKLFSKPEQLQPLFPSPLSKSPNKTSIFEQTSNLASSLSKTTFDLQLDKKGFEKSKLDISLDSESAPAPPPRPASNISPIKPPPLPPKKQNDTTKPPPRPPHTEESHYDYMESYETAPNSLDSTETGPPLPVPARKSRFDQDFTTAPQRPKKNLSGTMSDEDYLTPVPPPLLPPQKKDNSKSKDSILLPPPKRESSKRNIERNVILNGSQLDQSNKSQVSPNSEEKNKLNADTLDITLSQLTVSGLNELAVKLKIPPSQLSNMTLVQLTNYISNYVKGNQNVVPNDSSSTSLPVFNADFPTNFDAFNESNESTSTKTTEPYDRYAVFRELLQQEELNKTVEVSEKKDIVSNIEEEIPVMKTSFSKETLSEISQDTTPKSTFQNTSSTTDRYAALRDIVIDDPVIEQKENNFDIKEEDEEEVVEENKAEQVEQEDQNDLNKDSFKNDLEIKDKLNDVENNIIPYESNENKEILKEKLNDEIPIKSPVTIADTNIKLATIEEPQEVTQTNNHITSGSLSDAVTNSSPEIDNLANSETVEKNNVENTTGESWAIFDTANIEQSGSARVQSEEGVSPWSSDSKEFGNGSPLDWQQRRDSESEGDWGRKAKGKGDNWWKSHGETQAPYEKQKHPPPYVRDRRSTDSYEDEWYEEEAQRRGGRRRRQPMWGRGTGEHSSSSRDVSPWDEDEPHNIRRDDNWHRIRSRDGRDRSTWDRLPRRDSWEEDDDYDYEDDYVTKYQYHSERHGSRESDRGSRDSDRHSTPRGEPPDDWERPVSDQWSSIDRKHVHRKNPHDDRWSRGEWDREDKSVFFAKDKRYGSRYSNTSDTKWREDRDRKRDTDRYYKREHSQESPWEDEYSNDPDEPPQSPRYVSSRRSWKRPSSASEMDRKTGEIKSRQQPPYYVGTGGSDGERDRRYKPNRRSRSRDSQFSEISSHNRHKPDPGLTLRYPHRSNRDKFYSTQKFESNFISQEIFNKTGKIDTKLDSSNNKKSMMANRKKVREAELPSPKTENDMAINKNNRKQHLMFENDFVNSETDSPISIKTNKFNFENDFETSEAESPTVGRQTKFSRAHTMFESDHNVKRNIRPSMKQTVDFDSEFSKESKSKHLRSDFRDKDIIPKTSPTPKTHLKQISMFEDDFSPTEKIETQFEENTVSVIPEEIEVTEQRVSFSENNLDRVPSIESRKHRHILNKSNRGSSSRADNIKKSESVNIFARENDPFDDDFFKDESESINNRKSKNLNSSSGGEFKWTEDFDSFDIPEVKNNK